MQHVLSVLVNQHDYKMVLVAALVCFCASVTAFRLYSRLRGSRRMVRMAWLLLTGLVAGAGAWATHFIAMIAHEHGLKTGYLPGATLVSLLLGIGVMAAGFAGSSASRSPSNQVAGGVVIGVGVAVLHYTGIMAVVTEGRYVWEPALVGLSVIVGVAGAVAALFAGGRCVRKRDQAAAGLLLTLGVTGLHFTSMAAVTIVPDAAIHVPDHTISGSMLSLTVGVITTVIVLVGLGVAIIEASTTNSALERIRRLANAAYEGIVVIKEGRINDCNLAFAELAGASIPQLRGRRLIGEILTYDDGGAHSSEDRREGLLRPCDGSREIPVEIFARLMDDGAREETSGLTVLALRDLRERRFAEEKIRYLAEHDGLTGLPNRNSLQSRLDAALERVEASGERLALICIDLDHFKEANDLHGHQAGDALLVEVSRRLQNIVAAPSFAARLGGDEFVVVLVGGDQPGAAAELAGDIIEALGESVTYEHQELSMAASLGISLFPDDGRTGEALLANADMALYRAKENGRGGYRFFKREMDESIRERRNLARELRHAIGAEELVLHYQPLARAVDGEVCGFEALVRWTHPTRGLVSPADFIPLAEESGLILPLGEWVLRQACADAATWEKPLRIAVNLSPLQLHQGALPNLVHEVLMQTGLAPERLELEITEGALFKDYQRALDTLRRLKSLGVRIAMDDFGTGFSSLSTLQSFPFDKIKIDKSFVENIHRHDRATVIVRAVLGLGRSLEIPVVAEGVETDEQLAFLRGEACAEVQGYFIGRPAPSHTLGRWTAGGQIAAVPVARRSRKANVA